jgi:hypothetical protein
VLRQQRRFLQQRQSLLLWQLHRQYGQRMMV